MNKFSRDLVQGMQESSRLRQREEGCRGGCSRRRSTASQVADTE